MAKLGCLGAQIYNKVLVGVKVKRKVEVHRSLSLGKLLSESLIFMWLCHMVFKPQIPHTRPSSHCYFNCYDTQT